MLKQVIHIIYIKYIAWIKARKDKNGKHAHRASITAVHDRVTSTLRFGHARDGGSVRDPSNFAFPNNNPCNVFDIYDVYDLF